MSGRRRLLLVLAGAVLAIGAVAGLAVFQPWLLFVDVRVDDALPTAAPSPEPTGSATPSAAQPIVLLTGTFTSHEHATTGTASIVQNPDGTRILALAGLETSNGPDLHVWLSASDVVEGPEGWFVAGSAPYVDLGPLRGNLGDQVYEIPADADLGAVRSVAIWCVAFSVSFGAAQLA